MAEPKPRRLPLTELTAITPLDGRYRSGKRGVEELAPYVSEYGLIRTRVEIEAKYLVELSDVGVVRPLSGRERTALNTFDREITLKRAEEVKKIEDTTQHDVKAMELVFRELVAGTSLENLIERIHFGLTSEDVNNLAYRLQLMRATRNICVPAMDTLVDEMVGRADEFRDVPMIARTHGQAAVPTTIGHEFAVFAKRLNDQTRELQHRQLNGKLNGAVGGFNALAYSRPEVDWISFSKRFVASLGLVPSITTTQINPYDDVAAYFQNYQRANGVILDFNQDMWRYISDDWFVQKVVAGETGSSTMTQKINPIRFENGEGNIGMANTIAEFLARKLQVSRLQRDLSDSTSIRNLGSVLGYSLLAYKNTLDGLSRISPNRGKIQEQLMKDWSVLGEGVQTILRDKGFPDAYSLLAAKTRGKKIAGQAEWVKLVDELPIDDELKDKFRDLTPQLYIGLADEITQQTVREIRMSR